MVSSLWYRILSASEAATDLARSCPRGVSCRAAARPLRGDQSFSAATSSRLNTFFCHETSNSSGAASSPGSARAVSARSSGGTACPAPPAAAAAGVTGLPSGEPIGSAWGAHTRTRSLRFWMGSSLRYRTTWPSGPAASISRECSCWFPCRRRNACLPRGVWGGELRSR